ncbi:uncharacterized protein misp3 [Archocentrus centrarchus]|uniref:uncharacterized protein misp3 n=1 Tax=Archocentrus centrarchus TaxID=63155 RepID=UPI0011E9FAAE|nr:uncharacterized protein LOC115796324 [Archocentrus centrarchus]
MATKPTAWQEPCPVSSLDELFSESRAKGDNSPLKDKMAPKAEPEEDIDILEPGAQVKTLQENQTVSKIKMAEATKVENEGAMRISQCTHGERKEVVTQLEQGLKKLGGGLRTQEEPEEPAELCGESFLPLPSTDTLSSGEYGGKEGFSSLEGEVAESISDVEVISGPTEDKKNSQEWPKTSPITEPVDKTMDTTSEEMAAEKHISQFHFVPDGISCSIMENRVSQTAHHSPSDSDNPHDAHTASSPPFADESEEEEEVALNIMDLSTLDTNSKSFQPSYSASTHQEPDSALHVKPSSKQQEELLPQYQCEPAPKGANQEAAQQVPGQGFSPLSTVAMEPSNQGGAAFQGCACVVAVRERHSRAGERTEGENEQTGGVKGQKGSGLGRNKPAGQLRSRGLLRYSHTVQIQELEREKHSLGVSLEHSKHTRMENDSCDDSQSDSGVSADFSPCSTLEGSPGLSRETPIEREIRKAVEREHSLRRSRGLPNLPISPEYVEVPLRKTVLCHSITTKTEWCQEKDREFAGKKMLYEIQAEAQREQDLVKLGKVPGFYDKGTVRQIREKKQLFEAFQTPSDSTFTVSTRSKAPSISSASNVSATENQENISSQVSTTEGTRVKKRHSLDLLSPAQSPNSPNGRDVTKSTLQGPGNSEGPVHQVLILENNLKNATQKKHQDKPESITAVDSGNPYISSSQTGEHNRLTEKKQEKEEEEDLIPKENPFFKLRPSNNLVKVKQDIQEAQEREKEIRKQRISLYGGCDDGGAQGEEARNRGRPVSMEVRSPMLSLNGLAVSDTPGSSSKGETGPSAAHPSVSKSFVWPPEDEKLNRPEVLQSPRTPRQKSPLVQLWETSLVNGHNKDKD